ncbi:MAG TPA: energy-coupling factor transporter transmembrane component T, partial [Atopostipes sp.]|nr:energy-coupling factor transporter transmembrane component T [Atopostipes sp.]
IELFMIFIYISPLFIAGLYSWGLTFLFIYALQILISVYLVPKINIAFIIFVLSFLIYGLRFLLPSIIAGAYSMKTTAVSEWIAAFKKLHLPNWLLIPLAVMARFFPTIREDYHRIRQAMAFRGIGTGFWDLVKHPIQTLEFILIPLLMNATQVSEDLTISSLTKGLSLAGKHTSIVQLKMTAYDWIYAVLAFVPIILHLGGI